jgi:hypothetical protein
MTDSRDIIISRHELDKIERMFYRYGVGSGIIIAIIVYLVI